MKRQSLACAGAIWLLSNSSAWAQAPLPVNLPPPPADLKNFEGVWMPSLDMPKGAKPGGPPPSAPVLLGSLGRDEKGAGTASSQGSTLECTPIQRLSGASGGMSNLWIEGRDEILMISEEDQDVRKFYLRDKHPANIVPQPNGNSIAHWEGNTLVVDSVGFAKPGTSEDIGQHIIERVHREGTQLIDDVTVEYKGQTQKLTYKADWRPDLRVWENVCEEGYQRYELVNGEVDSPDKPAGKGQ